MAYCGYVTELANVRSHPNADRMLLADCFGNTICVGLTAKTGDIGIYFPTDGQLSVEYCAKNDLVRQKDENGNEVGGYLDPNKRNVTAIRLRGEKSDGLFMPLESLEYTGVKMSDLTIGTTITTVNGHEICQKYIPRGKQSRQGAPSTGNHTRKKKAPIAPLFAEHADTEQLAYNMGAFQEGDLIEITLKMHGTSQRTGYLPTLQGYKRTLWDKIRGRAGTPIYDWGYVTGTRRTVLNPETDSGFYGSDPFRRKHARQFEGKLWKGETVYYEVVGFTDSGVPIMSDCANSKLNDKGFIKQYGKTTTFSYGCAANGKKAMYGKDEYGKFEIETDVPQSDFYVYRMTMTNEDGEVVEYTPDFMRYRCEQMGVKCVPVFWKGYLEEPDDWCGPEPWTPGEWIKSIAEDYYDGPDPVGKTHVREGVVIRIINRPKFCAYKHKNFSFKCLEGIVKAEATEPDMEEAENEYMEVNNNEAE